MTNVGTHSAHRKTCSETMSTLHLDNMSAWERVRCALWHPKRRYLK